MIFTSHLFARTANQVIAKSAYALESEPTEPPTLNTTENLTAIEPTYRIAWKLAKITLKPTRVKRQQLRRKKLITDATLIAQQLVTQSITLSVMVDCISLAIVSHAAMRQPYMVIIATTTNRWTLCGFVIHAISNGTETTNQFIAAN